MKAILLLNLYPNFASGAMKRYIAMYNRIAEQRDDYCFIINQEIYDLCRPVNILNTDKNVFVLRLNFIQRPVKNSSDHANNIKVPRDTTTQKNKNHGKIRLILGSFKYFLYLFITWVFFVFQFAKIILKYRITHVYSVWTGGMWAWPLKSILQFKLFYSANGYTFTHLSKSIFYFFDTEYWVLKNADKIDFLSPSMVGILEERIGKINPSRVSISPNSFIDYSLFFPIFPKTNTVVFMARLFWDKNPLVFLESVSIFNQNYPDWQNVEFLILGEGPMEQESREYVRKYKLSNVQFKGSVPKPYEYLKRSKIFVSIQIGNNYPSQSLMEAMACENAIIATDVGETRLLVTEQEGLLIDLDPNKLAEGLIKLISFPELQENLGSNARKKVLSNHNLENLLKYFYVIMEN